MTERHNLSNAWVELLKNHPELAASPGCAPRQFDMLESPLHAMSGAERERLLAAIDHYRGNLNEPNKTILSLWNDGLTQTKIAEAVHLSQKTVSVRLKQMRKRLRELKDKQEGV